MINSIRVPPRSSTCFRFSGIAGSLLGQKNYADADVEPLLLAGYEGMKEREAKTPEANAPGSAFRQRLTEALERLVQLYDPGAPGGQARPGGRVAGEVATGAGGEMSLEGGYNLLVLQSALRRLYP